MSDGDGSPSRTVAALVPIEYIEFDEQVSADTDATYDLAALTLSLTLGQPTPLPPDKLPAIKGRLVDGRIVVSGAHKYFKVARSAGMDAIRVIFPSLSGEDVSALADRPGVEPIDIKALLAYEAEHPVVEQWHLLVFDQPLSDSQFGEFQRRIVGFFADLANGRDDGLYQPSHLVREEARVSFMVPVLASDQSWYGWHLAVLRDFDRDVARIDTFRGHHLPRGLKR